MNISIERPYAFYGLLLLIPTLLYMIIKYYKLVHAFGLNLAVRKGSVLLTKFKQRYIVQTVLRAISWMMLVLAYAGISWGTNLVPVQKSGNAVSFVFDISYSMEAEDAAGGLSRLESAANYAEVLLSRMEGTSVSVVLTKGDGTVAVPLTEDMNAVLALLDTLSPQLMTSEGTSLGKGIETAINSFPQQSSQAAHVWVFTDGDETDGMLAPALSNAVKFGIPVTLIGFGSERETEIVAGDGESRVKTALRAQTMRKTIASVQKRNSIKEHDHFVTSLSYVDATEVGSASHLLRSLQKEAVHARQGMEEDTTTLTYEVRAVQRKNIFIALAIFFFVLSFVLGELMIVRHQNTRAEVNAMLVCCMTLLCTSCSGRFDDGAKILQGKLAWNRKDYQQAIACFLQAAENSEKRNDSEYEQYALYDLASTYLMQNETEAAVDRFDQIVPNAPDAIRFAVFYNLGIIAHKNGNYKDAVGFFKSALSVDSTSTDAKINLELSIQQDSVQTKANEQVMTPVTQNADEQAVENAVYSLIRENDQNQWKSQQQETKSTSKDY